MRADVFANGQKIAGAAQRRTRDGLLHQGSVQGADLRWEAKDREAITEAFAAALTADSAAVRMWRYPLEETPDFAATLCLANALAKSKYGNPAWLAKR